MSREGGTELKITSEHEAAFRPSLISPEKSKELSRDVIQKEWLEVTKVVLFDMKNNSEVRKVMCDYAGRELSEDLIVQFFRSLMKVSESIRTTLEQNTKLWEYLSIPPVQGSLIEQHVGRTTPMDTLDDMKKRADTLGATQADFDKEVLAEDQTNGIYQTEKNMVILRQALARDIKFFTLGAELLESGNTQSNTDTTLESGTHIHISPHQAEGINILNPLEWKKKKQIRERMYEVEVNGKKFILKEKKTKYHRNVGSFSVEDSNSAKDEFKIAELFQNEGTRIEDGIELNWEAPVGYVEFPDGYQFTVFEYVENMFSEEQIESALPQYIKAYREQFESEYQELTARLQKDIPFEMYSELKSRRMLTQAERALRQTQTKLGYQNLDSQGNHSFKVYPGEKNLQLEAIGFDFEHYKPIVDSAEKIAKYKELSDKQDDYYAKSAFRADSIDQSVFRELLKIEREKRNVNI